MTGSGASAFLTAVPAALTGSAPVSLLHGTPESRRAARTIRRSTRDLSAHIDAAGPEASCSSRQAPRISFQAPFRGRFLSSSTHITYTTTRIHRLEIGIASRVDVRAEGSSNNTRANMTKGELLYLMQMKREIMRQGLAEPDELRELGLPDVEEFDFDEQEAEDDLGITKKNPKKRDLRKAVGEKERKERLATRPGPRTQKWEEMLKKLSAYHAAHGDFDVPRRWPEDPELGAWVKKQRTDYTKGILSETRSKKLMSLGFSFDRKAAADREEDSDGGSGRRPARPPRRPVPSGPARPSRTRASSVPAGRAPASPASRPRALRVTPAAPGVSEGAIPLPPLVPASPEPSVSGLRAAEEQLSPGVWSSTIACLSRSSSRRMGRVNSGAASRLRAEVLALESDPLDGWSSSESEEDTGRGRGAFRRRRANPATSRAPRPVLSDASGDEVVALGPAARALESLPAEPRRPRLVRTRRPAKRPLSGALSE